MLDRLALTIIGDEWDGGTGTRLRRRHRGQHTTGGGEEERAESNRDFPQLIKALTTKGTKVHQGKRRKQLATYLVIQPGDGDYGGGDGGSFCAEDGRTERSGNPVLLLKQVEFIFRPAAFGADGENRFLLIAA